MRTTVVFIPNPQISSWMLFADQHKFWAKVREEGYINVSVKFHTKTTLYISVTIGEFNFSVNKNYDPSLPYHEGKPTGIYDERPARAYFLKFRAGLPGIERHVAKVFEGIGLEHLEIRLYVTEPIRQLQLMRDKQTKGVHEDFAKEEFNLFSN